MSKPRPRTPFFVPFHLKMTSANQAIDPSKLSISQLQFLAKSLDEENSLLTSNFNQLKVAHAKFLDAAACATTVANTTESACGRSSLK